MEYGYVREGISTKTRDASQVYRNEYDRIKVLGAETMVSDHFQDTERNRPELKRLIPMLKDGDVVYVIGLWAFADSMGRAMDVAEIILSKGASIYLDGVGMISYEKTELYHLFMKIKADERTMGMERNYEGKAVARKNIGFSDGRPRVPAAALDEAIYLLSKKGLKMSAVVDKTGISRSTILREIKKRSK